MLALTHLNKNNFNHHFLKFRMGYYFTETRELLARHKLLMAFIICLLAPGIKNIQAIGIPFYSIIDPTLSLKVKLMYLMPLLSFLMALTKAQSSFIRGGAFREYLHTLYIPTHVHKAIDFIILLLSLNLIWLAVFFGGATIYRQIGSPAFILSQYCLYSAMIASMMTLLLNVLYKKWTNSILLISALVFVAILSAQSNWQLNTSISLLIFVLCGAMLWKVEPFEQKRHPFKAINIAVANHFKLTNLLKRTFLFQLAVYRENRKSFLIRLLLCLALSILMLNLFSSSVVQENRIGLFLFLTSVATYILSTLFIFFEKGRVDYALFHQVFPYQRTALYIKEITFVAGLLVLVFSPLLLFCLFSTRYYFSIVVVTIAINIITLLINRVLYAQSLRFCLFTSLITTVGMAVAQSILLGACFEY